MKKSLALILTAVIILSAFSITASATAPVYVITPIDLASTANGYSNVTAELINQDGESFCRYTTTGGDPNVNFAPVTTFSKDAKYVAFKYRTTAATSVSLYYTVAEPSGSFTVTADGQWHIAYLDASAVGANWQGRLNRFDPTNNMSGQAVIDYAWIAFFSDEASRSAYDGFITDSVDYPDEALYDTDSGTSTGWWLTSPIVDTKYINISFETSITFDGFSSFFYGNAPVTIDLINASGTVVDSQLYTHPGDGAAKINFSKSFASGRYTISFKGVASTDKYFVLASANADADIKASVEFSGALTNENTKAAPYITLIGAAPIQDKAPAGRSVDRVYINQDVTTGDGVAATDIYIYDASMQLGSSISLLGWVIVPSAMKKMVYTVDGGDYIDCENAYRDRDDLIGDGTNAGVGLDTNCMNLPGVENLEAGDYKIKVYAESNDGEYYIFATINLTVSATPATYRVCIDGIKSMKGAVSTELSKTINSYVIYKSAAESLRIHGWYGANYAIESFGYKIDDNATVYNLGWGTVCGVGDAVLDPGNGGKYAMRYDIYANVTGLTAGEHTVSYVAKLVNGAVLTVDTRTITIKVPTVTVKSITTVPGKTVSVDLYISNNPGIATLVLDIDVPEVLNGFTLSGASVEGSVLSNLTFGGINSTRNIGDTIRLTWINGTANNNSDGKICTLKFDIPESAADNTVYDIDATFVQAYSVDDVNHTANIVDYTFTAEDGTITIDYTMELQLSGAVDKTVTVEYGTPIPENMHMSDGSTTYNSNGIVDIAINYAQPSLAESIAIGYYVTISDELLNGGIPQMTFTYDDKQYAVNGVATVKAVSAGYKEYLFLFTGILPQCMNYNIFATITVNGATVTKSEYSVKQYCMNKLAMSAEQMAMTEEELAEFRCMLVNILFYGDESQKYKFTDVTEENLATYGLTQEQKDYRSESTVANASSVSAITGANETDSYQWKSATLTLEDKVNLKYRFKADSVENLAVKMTVNANTTIITEFVNEGNGYYSIDFCGINPSQLDETITSEFFVNGVKTGGTLSYSVASYVNSKKDVTELADIIRAIYDYGTSVKAYITD